MQKTNALKKTFLYLILAFTAVATLFMFTACDFGNKIPDAGDSDNTGNTGDQDVTHTKTEVKTAIQNAKTTLNNTTDATYNDEKGEERSATVYLQDLCHLIDEIEGFFGDVEFGTVYKVDIDKNYYVNFDMSMMLQLNNTNNNITLVYGSLASGNFAVSFLTLDYDFATQKLNSVSLNKSQKFSDSDIKITKSQYNCNTKVFSIVDVEQTSSEYKQIYNQSTAFVFQLADENKDFAMNNVYNVFSWAHTAIQEALNTESPDANLEKLDNFAFKKGQSSINPVIEILQRCSTGLNIQQIQTSSDDCNLFVNKTVNAVRPSSYAIVADNAITLQVYCADEQEYFATVQVSFDKDKKSVTNIVYNFLTVNNLTETSRTILADKITFDPTTGQVDYTSGNASSDATASFDAFKEMLA